jgi:hypothetical protein
MYSNNDTRDYSKPKQRMSKPFCKVCFQSGCSPEQYNSHYVRANPASTSKVVCPTLLRLKCNYCKKNGHTISHCNVLAEKKGFSSTDELKTHVIQERSKRVVVDLFQNMTQTQIEETLRNEEIMDDIERMMQEDEIHHERAENPLRYMTMTPPPPLYRQDYEFTPNFQANYQPVRFNTPYEHECYPSSDRKRRRLNRIAVQDDPDIDYDIDYDLATDLGNMTLNNVIDYDLDLESGVESEIEDTGSVS